jgi:hypothetical protein
MLQKHTISQSIWDTLLRLQEDSCLEKFVLGGGTGLSLQIGHRVSEDIDMFSNEPMKKDGIINSLNALFGNKITLFYSDDSVLQISIDDIKVDLVSFNYTVLEDIKNEENIRIFGLKDIGAMKLAAIGSNTRHKAKDYTDIAYLLKYISLETMLESFCKKYNKNDITYIKKRLCEGSTVNPYEWNTVKMLDKSIYLSDVPKMLTDEVNRYNKSHDLITKRRWFW